MNALRFLDFLRAHPRLVVSLMAMALAIGLAQSCKTVRHGAAPEILATFTPANSNQHVTVTRKTPDLPSMAPRIVSSPASNPPPTVVVIFTNLSDPMLSIHAPPDSNAPPSGPFLPTGRLVPCVLVSGVDSATPDSSIIGFVAQDVWWAGELVLPVGTEVHSRARLDRVRNRIMSEGRWVFVWKTGEELAVPGIAMHRDYDANTRVWGPDDCTPGLFGRIIRSTSLDEIKLFLATALSGFAMGMQQQTTTVLGIEHIPATARNAALAGTSQVLNTYAQQVLDEIKKNGLYVHVPGGQQFYVYTTEPIDRLKARIAGSRVLSQPPVERSTQTAAAVDSATAPTLVRQSAGPLLALPVPQTR